MIIPRIFEQFENVVAGFVEPGDYSDELLAKDQRTDDDKMQARREILKMV